MFVQQSPDDANKIKYYCLIFKVEIWLIRQNKHLFNIICYLLRSRLKIQERPPSSIVSGHSCCHSSNWEGNVLPFRSLHFIRHIRHSNSIVNSWKGLKIDTTIVNQLVFSLGPHCDLSLKRQRCARSLIQLTVSIPLLATSHNKANYLYHLL